MHFFDDNEVSHAGFHYASESKFSDICEHAAVVCGDALKPLTPWFEVNDKKANSSTAH